MFKIFRNVPRVELAAGVLSLGISVLLVGVKFLAYYLTGSSAIFSDALENVVNIISSSFALYALAVAHHPADEEHPYGHGKIEFISAGFEGGMIALAALVIAYKAIAALVTDDIPLEKLGWGMLLTAAAMLVNAGVGLYLIRLGRKRDSITLEADGHHLLADVVTSIAALAALLIVQWFRFPYADPIAALLMAGYIGYVGAVLLSRSGAGLMDRQDATDRKLLRTILDGHLGIAGRPPRICGYHKLRHRHSGRYHWIDFHIFLSARFNLEQGHNVASAIEHEIEQTLGEGNATAHIEPCIQPECDNCKLPADDVPLAPPHLRPDGASSA